MNRFVKSMLFLAAAALIGIVLALSRSAPPLCADKPGSIAATLNCPED